MRSYWLSHLSDDTLLRNLNSLVARERAATAELLAHIAEVDARRLYLPAAHPSMFSYCVHELRLSEDAASKRIQAARVARQFPAIFEALTDGRLHLSAVVLLAPYLAPANAEELLAAAGHKTKAGVEELIARRFPRSETMALMEALPPAPPAAGGPSPRGQTRAPVPKSEALACQHAPGHAAPPSRVAPVAADRFLLQLTIGRATRDKLRHAQELLGHELSPGDIAQIFDRALDALIERIEKSKWAATTRPRPGAGARPGTNPRHIPAEVRRAVWGRDQGRCTFVGETGRRCAARTRLEYDHVVPVARGGMATEGNTRLRCRAHNQFEAERMFGAAFMRRRRERAQHAPGHVAAQAEAAGTRARGFTKAQARTWAAAEFRAHSLAGAPAQAGADAERAREKDVTPWLRKLGYRADEARRAAELCERIPDASLEDRIRLALSYFVKPCQLRSARVQPAAT